MKDLVIEYLAFALVVLATFAFNIYNSLSGPKEKTKANYVFASGAAITTWPMLLSITRGFMGVRVFLGYPSELFYRGSEMWETLYGIILAFPIVGYFFVPVYYSLGITSVYQYLDLRFKSRLVRRLASGTYVLRSILNLGTTVYTPCVALKIVIGLPHSVSIVGITSIGVFFAIVGGIGAAILADAVQTIAMMLCCVVIIIQGTIDVDGPMNVIKIGHEQGRLDFFNFDLDPTKRVSTTSALIGQFFISLSLYGCQQSFVQRYLSMKSQEKVTRTLWINIPFMTVMFSLSWVVGMVIYAVYAECDPKSLGYITDIDEILPFYIGDKLAFLPGFLGLSTACLFNGSISFLSSNLNSLAIVTWEDFLSHLPWFNDLKERSQLTAIKATVVVLGICVIGISFCVGFFSGVIESSQMMTSATSGPLLGVFVLAMFIPHVNWKGAASGVIISHLITIWLAAGGLLVDKPPLQYLPTTTTGCHNESFSPHIVAATFPPLLETSNQNTSVSSHLNSQLPFETESDDVLTWLYKITYMYYALSGTIITVVVGVVVSYFTGTNKECLYSENLVHPFVRKFSTFSVEEPEEGGEKEKLKMPTISEIVDNIHHTVLFSEIKDKVPVSDIKSSYTNHAIDMSA